MAAISDYIAAVPDDAIRTLLIRLRAVIAGAAPHAVEDWAYGMPAFRYRGTPIDGFAAATAWVGSYPMSGSLVERHASELAGFSTAKGTVRLTPETGVPVALIAAMVRERVAEVDAKATRP